MTVQAWCWNLPKLNVTSSSLVTRFHPNRVERRTSGVPRIGSGLRLTPITSTNASTDAIRRSQSSCQGPRHRQDESFNEGWQARLVNENRPGSRPGRFAGFSLVWVHGIISQRHDHKGGYQSENSKDDRNRILKLQPRNIVSISKDQIIKGKEEDKIQR